MGGKSSLMLREEEIKQIADETGYSAPQIEKLYARFAHLDRDNCGALSRHDLLSIPELAINPLCERLIEIFLAGASPPLEKLHGDAQRRPQRATPSSHQPDEQADPDERRINFREFMRVLAAFRSSSSPTRNDKSAADERTGRSGSPPREVATSFAEGPKQPAGDCLRDKLHFVFKIYDADRDGRISFNDLRTVLKLMVGEHLEAAQLDKIATRAFLEVDRDHDGFIEFYEFCRVFAGKDLDLFRLSI